MAKANNILLSSTAAKLIRSEWGYQTPARLATGRSVRGQFTVKELTEEISQQKDLRKKRSNQTAYTGAEWLRINIRKSIEKRAAKIARLLPDPGYSMGSVYAVNIVSPTTGKRLIAGYFNDTDQYCGDYKGRETHGRVEMSLTPSEFYNVTMIAGLLTVRGEEIGRNLHKATWWQGSGKKQYFTFTRVEGYIYRDHHFTAGSDGAAVDYVRIYREKQIAAYLERKHRKEILEMAASFPLSQIWVSVQDSYAAGNCEPGTIQFADDKHIDLKKVGAVRADFLQTLGNGRSIYVNKAIQAAAMRYAKAAFQSSKNTFPENFL